MDARDTDGCVGDSPDKANRFDCYDITDTPDEARIRVDNCDPTHRLPKPPTCAKGSGAVCLPPMPVPTVKLEDGSVVSCDVGKDRDDEIGRLCRAATRAMQWTAETYGWWGIDGKGSAPEIVIDPKVNTAQATGKSVKFNTTEWFGKASDEKIDAFMVHEFLHLSYPSLAGEHTETDFTEESRALNEGISQTGEDELTDGAEFTTRGGIPKAFPQPVVRWTDRAEVADDSGQAHLNGSILEAISADIAHGTTTGDTFFNWHAAGEIRMVAQRHFGEYVEDGAIGLGEVRQAYIEAAKELGTDPALVAAAFDRQGITSIDWKPPVPPAPTNLKEWQPFIHGCGPVGGESDSAMCEINRPTGDAARIICSDGSVRVVIYGDDRVTCQKSGKPPVWNGEP